MTAGFLRLQEGPRPGGREAARPGQTTGRPGVSHRRGQVTSGASGAWGPAPFRTNSINEWAERGLHADFVYWVPLRSQVSGLVYVI